jgi:signal transduction histidine kinase
MSGSKSNTNKNSVSVSLYANNLTKSLIAKISGVLAITFLLLIIMGIVTFLNISDARNVTNAGIISQNKSEKLNTIHAILEKEHSHLQKLIANPALEIEFPAYEKEFKAVYLDLVSTPNSNFYELFSAHDRLVQDYTAFSNDLKATPNDPTLSARAIKLNQDNEILKTSASRLLEKQNAETKTVINRALDIQNSGFSQILILLLGALIVTGLLTWFVIGNVITPLNRLNIQLSQLLWEQTEHLTDRLNQQQYIISTTNDKFSAVRHDLKSPLSNIKGLAEVTLLTTNNISGDTGNYLGQIIQITDKSSEMINSVLATRQTEVALQLVNLTELFDKVLQLVDLRLFSVKKEIKLDRAILDPALMEHALLNLISNARKFSSMGVGVGSNLVRKPGSITEMEVELWVWNDGAIIPSGEREEIFKPGRQTSEGKKAGGHGLGLYIVKTIAEQHNGRVTVESHEKIGTTFRIIIPFIKAEG